MTKNDESNERDSSLGNGFATLNERVEHDFGLHFVRSLANPGPNGLPPQWLLDSPPHKYLLEVLSALARLDLAMRQAQLAIKQIENPPPDEWLDTIGISKTDLFQQQIDSCAVILYSILDRCLLLTNTVLDLALQPRETIFERVKKLLKNRDPGICESLSKLRKAVEPLADPRHFYVHRGEHRKLDLFSAIHRFEKIADTFSLPMEGVRINYIGARWEILKTIRDEIAEIDAAVELVKASLLNPYEQKLAELGGIESPSKEEIDRASQVLNWFQGGKEPSWYPME